MAADRIRRIPANHQNRQIAKIGASGNHNYKCYISHQIQGDYFVREEREVHAVGIHETRQICELAHKRPKLIKLVIGEGFPIMAEFE